MGETTIPFLKEIGTFEIPVQPEFITEKKFVVNTAKESKIKIFGLSLNIEKSFLPKNEEPVASMKLRYAELIRYKPDGPIMAELGDKKKITLSQIFALMSRQPNGEEGVLLTDGRPNIFYVRDSKGGFCGVGVGWGDYYFDYDFCGWVVYAVLGDDVHRYRGGRVFSSV
ncbi:MAG: hypothetical protein Q7K28_02670 [Candidatus Wildermuthbacteria bacterium]|nr:hypothetical protein [Candidatus Wildermuthbacteria bacterium]